MTELLGSPHIGEDVRQRMRSLPLRTVTAADPDWDTARQAWNLAVDQRPAVVAYPETADDVRAVISAAAESGLRVAPQTTGHRAGALGDLAEAVLLRTDRMREVTVSPQTHTIRVGAGVTWGEAAAALAPYGRVGLAGSAADVGITGYVLGGGLSWFARKYGLACNSLTAAELVTGDGVHRRVDAEHEPELFWSLRGGQGTTGIVTALELKTFPCDVVYAGMLLYPLEWAWEVLAAYGRWTEDLHDAATTSVRLLRLPPLPDLPDGLRGGAFVGIDGAIDLPANESAALLQPLRDLDPVVDTFDDIPGSRLAEIHMDPPGPVPGVTDGAIIDALTDQAIEALLDAAGPAVSSPLLAVELRHLKGALGRPVHLGGAIEQLPGTFLLCGIGIAGSADAADAVRRSIDGLKMAMAPWTVDRSFPNFSENQPDPASPQPPRFYTDDAAARLADIRAHHDPGRLVMAAHE